jgi:colicin import membrane protein
MDHGANGRFFTDSEARGEITLKESDVAKIYQATAKAVIAGTVTEEVAVKQLANQLQVSADEALEGLRAELARQRTSAEATAEQKEVVAKRKAAPKEKVAKGPRVKLEHVEPEEFAAVRDRLGLSNKQVADALIDVVGAKPGEPPTLSRVTELTHSKGSSRPLFVKYETALVKYAKTHESAASIAAKAKAAKEKADAAAAKAKADAAAKAAKANGNGKPAADPASKAPRRKPADVGGTTPVGANGAPGADGAGQSAD